MAFSQNKYPEDNPEATWKSRTSGFSLLFLGGGLVNLFLKNTLDISSCSERAPSKYHLRRKQAKSLACVRTGP